MPRAGCSIASRASGTRGSRRRRYARRDHDLRLRVRRNDGRRGGIPRRAARVGGRPVKLALRLGLIAMIGVCLWFFVRTIDWDKLAGALGDARLWPLVPAVA